MSGQGSSKIYIVCSNQTRNGKTILARLYADYLTMIGRDFVIFDAESPYGDISRWYPLEAELVDLSRTQGQIKLFDSILSSEPRDYIIDLPARYLNSFFKIISDIRFVEEAAQAGFDCILLFIVDRTAESVTAARELLDSWQEELFVLVRNEAVGNVLENVRVAADYAALNPGAEIVLPALTPDALEYIERESFTFHNFLKKDSSYIPPEERAEIVDFIEHVFARIRAHQLQLDMAELKKAGVV
jgi:hypothetical protein